VIGVVREGSRQVGCIDEEGVFVDTMQTFNWIFEEQRKQVLMQKKKDLFPDEVRRSMFLIQRYLFGKMISAQN